MCVKEEKTKGHMIIKYKTMNYKSSKLKGHYVLEVAMIAVPEF